MSTPSPPPQPSIATTAPSQQQQPPATNINGGLMSTNPPAPQQQPVGTSATTAANVVQSIPLLVTPQSSVVGTSTPPPPTQQQQQQKESLNISMEKNITPPSTPESTSHLLNKHLNKILSDCSKKQQNIKEEIKNIYELLKANPTLLSGRSTIDESSVVKSTTWIQIVSHLSTIFRLSFESKNNKLIQSSVELVEKLISSNYIISSMYDINDQAKKPLIDKFIEPTLVHCVDVTDDMTLVQIIKLVHTAATKFHKYTLILSFKTIFYIYVHSKPQSNLSNASKTSITQILRGLCRHFKISQPIPHPNHHHHNNNNNNNSQSKPSSHATTPIGAQTPTTTGLTDHHGSTATAHHHHHPINHAINNVISLPTELQSPIINSPNFQSPPPPTPTNKQVLSDDTTSSVVSNIIDEMIDKVVISNKENDDQQQSTTAATTTVSIQQDNNNNNNNNTSSTTTTATTTTNIVVENQSKVIHPEFSTITDDTTVVDENEVLLRDAVLVFRLLCELSLKEIVDYDSPEIRIRIFSLELISLIFEEFGRYLKLHSDLVNYEIKEGLFPSIMASGVSHSNTIFKLSLTLFLYLLTHFRDFLKDQIGQYFSSIILRVLESTTSSIQHRWMVLQVLSHVCENSQILVDLYCNYDCSLNHKDIFQRMVEDLSKIAQTVIQDNKLHELKVKYYSLECLVILLKSLAEGLNSKRDGLTQRLALLPSENQFTKLKERKLKIEEGKAKFKASPKKGIEFFINLGVVEKEPETMAKFLRDTGGLDKQRIGEYIGEPDEFNIALLIAYIDTFNFTGYSIDLALRHFTSFFRLPGEAQKIDRIMENFAKKYFNDNCSYPNFEFGNSDSAYVLSFAIVMLATDLHSSAIKAHMTKPEWLKMNAGINDKKNFDESMLLGIYDRINAEPLKLMDDGDAPTSQQGALAAGGKIPTSVTFTLGDPNKAIIDLREKYHAGNLLEHIGAMLKSVWHPILVSLSLVFENTEEIKTTQNCLDGFKAAIDLTALLGQALGMEAFISALAMFTISEKIKELKPKNMEAFVRLISVGKSNGNYLHKGWQPLLKAISMLERFRMNFLGVNNPNGSDSGYKRTISTSDFFKQAMVGGSRTPTGPIIAEGMSIDSVGKEIEVANHLYMSTATALNDEAIVAFIESLINVAHEEIRMPTPSTFSLMKLVEVAIYNTSRIKLIWQPLSDFFIKIGTLQPHVDNTYVASLVIDSLKQLAQKFIDLEEQNKDQSQRDFLRPFEMIFAANAQHEVRELILKCIFQLTNGGRNSVIKSGWRPIFTIFTVASRADHNIASQAFDFVEELIKDFSYITETFFIDYVNCLSSYANSRHCDLSLKAIDSLNNCGVQLANGRVCQLDAREEGAGGSETTLFTDSEQHISLWFPLLTGLARVISHEALEPRTYALDTLFRVLALFGSTFSTKLWELIFRGVLLPIFDNVGYSKGQTETILEDTRWLIQTGDSAFKSLTEMFINFIDIICFLLDDMMDLFVSCILQNNEILAKTAGTFLIQLVTSKGNKFTDAQWSNVCSQFLKIFQTNTPFEIHDFNQVAGGKEIQQQQQQLNSIQENDLPLPVLSSSTSSLGSPIKNIKQPLSAPISPLFSSTNPNNNQINNNSNNNNNNNNNLSASLPVTPLSLTPPRRNFSEENMNINDNTQQNEQINNNLMEQLKQHQNNLDQNSNSNNNSNNNNNEQQPPAPVSVTVVQQQQQPTIPSVHSHNRSFSALPNLQSVLKKNHHSRTSSASASIGGNGNNNSHNSSNMTTEQQLKSIQSKCSVQLQMVQAINDVVFSHYEFLNTSQLLCLGDCLEISYHYCTGVYSDDKLSATISKIGTVLKILQQNTITGYLNLLIVLYNENCIDVLSRTVHSEYRLISLFKELIENYLRYPNESVVQTETILKILHGIITFNDEKFIRNMSLFYDLLIQLLMNDSKDVRSSLRDILIRVGKLNCNHQHLTT
ncbi:armadillo-like helical domain-containing protein [Cavenderia fasciculata]|uniref:Armadillo-like helical domain-containing protein n=1 Tax=Cavenderia fasciculata TaxID=261658 RepID=F4PP68_CACFS|nr:armadillo-like helical domain-containing protein [Cavenderia fasciculata]EGG22181.1 armadillo-like helical domain-containing protein [Cavenderia fasciculata]|eukprot:XP_004360032.1 armadillo-like helical domain-containing protein [Cavenderia fasciculata]